jgi:hypothetical protein
MPVVIENIVPDAIELSPNDKVLVRRGAGPLDFTMDLVDVQDVADLATVAWDDVTGKPPIVSIATGSAVLDFGAAPGTNTVETVVSTAIPAGASVRAWFQSEGNADHNEIEHRLIFPSRVGLTCGAITDGVGFTVYAETELRLTGDVTCRWQWSA